MRECPTVAGSSIPLILHRVTVGACQERQECNYHKCHRCIYRGRPADWRPDGEQQGGPQIAPAVAAREVLRRPVEVPLPAAPSQKPRRRRATEPSPA